MLLIDDDPKLVPLLRRGLAFEGFEVTEAPDGETGLALAREHQPHVVLLDITMPGLDGFEVCRRLRLQGDVGIVMLTARDAIEDKVSALNLGADDYLPKPFAFEELVARIGAVLRRRAAFDQPLAYGDLMIDPGTREVRRAGRDVELTPRQFELLLLFARNPRQVLARGQLMTEVWGYDQPDQAVLDVHIGHLRQKLEEGGEPRLIHTIRGIGFVLRG